MMSFLALISLLFFKLGLRLLDARQVFDLPQAALVHEVSDL